MKVSGLAVLCLGISISASAQGYPPQSSPPQSTSSQPTVPSTSSKFVLDDGTPIKLRLNRTLSSADAKTGDNIDFEVLEEVKVRDVVVIPKGSIAIGTITDA